MRILIALSYSPYPVMSGTDRLVMNLIKGLSLRHEIRLVTMTLDEEGIEILKEIENKQVGVSAILAPHRKNIVSKIFCKIRNILYSIFFMIPMQTLYAAPKEYINLVTKLSLNWEADLVLVNYWHLYKLSEKIKNTDIILITHDLDYLVAPGRISSSTGFIRRLFRRIDLAVKKRMEERAYRGFKRILTVTGKEAEELNSFIGSGGKVIGSLPMAIDLEKFNPAAYERKPDRVLLVGNFGSDFNADALLFMVKAVFPLVSKLRPRTILEIVGAGVPERIKSEAPKEILFTGRVESVIPYLGQCSLMVLPLRFAGGVRIRMLEAAAMAVPVVSTPAGVWGMNLVSGRDYIEAEGAEEFAKAVARVLENEEVAGELSRKVREWAEREISLETYPERLQETFEKML